MASRKPRDVIAYKMTGIHGLRRLAIRKPPERAYAEVAATRLLGDDIGCGERGDGTWYCLVLEGIGEELWWGYLFGSGD